MDNKISMLSLVENKSPFVSHAQQQIVEAVLRFFPNAESFAMYKDSKELLHGLSEAFSHSEVVILGADCTLYLSLKRLLFKVLNIESVSNADVLATIARNGEEVEESVASSHALIPKGSGLFISEDGFFSGFAAKSGRQHLIVLPLDTSRIDSVIQNGLIDYLNHITGGSVSTLGTESAVGSESPVPIAPKNNNIIIQAVEELISSELTVAIASTRTAAFVQNIAKAIPSSKKAFEFVTCDREKNGFTQKEYTAALARQARENSPCLLGAAISNVFVSEKDGGQQFVFVALSDSARSRVAKVFGEPGETPRMLVNEAVNTLFKMFIDYAQADGFTGYPNEEEKILPAQEKKSKTKLVLWLIICGIIAVLLSLEFIYFVAKQNAKNPTTAPTTGITAAVTTTGTASADLTDGIATVVGP